MTDTPFIPPFRPYAADEVVHGFNVRHGWFWNLTLLNGTEVAFDPDLVDPGRYGFSDAGAFQNLVEGGPANVAKFECKLGWYAKPIGWSTWTGMHSDRLDALRDAYRRDLAERERHKGADISFILGRKDKT